MSGIIGCESDWYRSVNKDYTVRPLLTHAVACLEDPKVRVRLFECPIKSILQARLSHRYRGYNVLYLSYEGVPSTIELSDGTVDLETLAEWMKDRFQGYAVHFGSCRMAVDTERLSWFKNTTGAIAVSGYTIQSEWWERFGALELALLGSYLRGKKRLDKVYTGLVKKNGLVIL